jgi:site-specific recombinase XerD
VQYKQRRVATFIDPGWMTPFLASLAHDDLSAATLRGYRYDLRHFLAWHRTVQDSPFTIEGLAEYELIAYRQHMVAAGRRPATVNRRLYALHRLCRWAVSVCCWPPTALSARMGCFGQRSE